MSIINILVIQSTDEDDFGGITPAYVIALFDVQGYKGTVGIAY